MNPQLSIIIPCFNSEDTLEETLNSVLNQNFLKWEAIIVNDGSCDQTENIALKWVTIDNRFKYFLKQNEGLGKARNFGISQSKGDFILPLDSDNKIKNDFVGKALTILENNPKVGVVYGDAYYFGEEQGYWKVGEFDKYRMLHHNYIDACAVIRKSLFESLGYYEENLPYQGHEDWEFWLRVLNSSYCFYYLQEITFDYRVTHNSMIRNFSNEMLKENIDYIHAKHANLYLNSYSELFYQYRDLKVEFANNTILKLTRKLKKKFNFRLIF